MCLEKSQSAMRAIRYGDSKKIEDERYFSSRNPLCVQLDMEFDKKNSDVVPTSVAIRYACN